jgi:hypothetical protein
MNDEPLLSPKRLFNGVRSWVFWVLVGLDVGFWQQVIYHHREHARVRKQGEDFPPLKYRWPGPDANLLH